MSASHLGKRARRSEDGLVEGESEPTRHLVGPSSPHPSASADTAHTAPGLGVLASTGISPVVPAVPATALLPVLDYISREAYLSSLAPNSPLSSTRSYFYRRAGLVLPTPTEQAYLAGVEGYDTNGNSTHLTMSDMHKFVRRLDVPAHSVGVCATLPDGKGKGKNGVNLVEVLRIDLGVQACGAVALHTDCKDQRCALIDARGVRPHTLILRGVPCLYGHVPSLISPEALDAVRDLTLVLDPNLAFDQNLSFAQSYMATKTGVDDPKYTPMSDIEASLSAIKETLYDAPVSGGTGLVGAIPRLCDRITIIFYPGPDGGVWDPPAHSGEGLQDSWPGQLFSQIAHAIAALPPRKRAFTFVNAGAIDPAAVLSLSDGEWWLDDIICVRVQSALEHWFTQCLREVEAMERFGVFLSSEQPSNLLTFTEFMSMHEWIAHGWRDVFDPWEVEHWFDSAEMSPSPIMSPSPTSPSLGQWLPERRASAAPPQAGRPLAEAHGHASAADVEHEAPSPRLQAWLARIPSLGSSSNPFLIPDSPPTAFTLAPSISPGEAGASMSGLNVASLQDREMSLGSSLTAGRARVGLRVR